MGGAISGYFQAQSARDSADASAHASKDAARIQAESQREALDYLKKIEKTPQALREEALKKLGGLSGLPGGEGTQLDFINQAIDSPLYQSIMSGKEVGEEAILRNASATGGLRSGDSSYNLYDYNIKLQNEALLTSYNEQLMGLQGLAQLPSNANAIATGTSAIGATIGQGMVASAQARQTGNQQAIDNFSNAMKTDYQAYQTYSNYGKNSGGMYSDRRLKTNLKKIGTVKGFNFYSFDWNSIANKMGLKGSTYGCMADEVFEFVPKAVTLRYGFMFVNYKIIGVL